MNRRTFLQTAGALALSVAHAPAYGATEMNDITAFKIAIPQADVAELKARLAAARWPVEVEPETWDRGIPGGYLRALAEAWRNLDWRAVETKLNAYEQVIAAMWARSTASGVKLGLSWRTRCKKSWVAAGSVNSLIASGKA